MAGFRLGLGGDGQQVLVALARDVVDGNLDLFLFRPFIDEIGAGLVGTGHPVVPESHGKLAGGVRAADVWRGNHCRGCQRGRSDELPARQFLTRHDVFSPW